MMYCYILNYTAVYKVVRISPNLTNYIKILLNINTQYILYIYLTFEKLFYCISYKRRFFLYCSTGTFTSVLPVSFINITEMREQNPTLLMGFSLRWLLVLDLQSLNTQHTIPGAALPTSDT